MIAQLQAWIVRGSPLYVGAWDRMVCHSTASPSTDTALGVQLDSVASFTTKRRNNFRCDITPERTYSL